MPDDMISVIVPIYNIKDYLTRCVQSIQNQTYQNLEILLVDDGSTDGTAELVDELAERDQRIRVFHKPNGGSSSARNLALQEARGKYLGFIDADDYIEPNMFEKLYRVMQEYQLPIAQGAREEIAEDGEVLPDICIPPDETVIYSSEEFMKELLLHKGDCSFCTKLTEASLFENIRFPEGVLNEDFHVLVQMLPQIAGIVSIPERVYHVFYKSNSNTRKQNPNEFSRVYGDNVDNADMVYTIVEKYYQDLKSTAIRFGLYQRLDYLLHIPISQMTRDNEQYQSIVKYLKRHQADIKTNTDLTRKNKLYLRLFSRAPKLIRKVHHMMMQHR